jgi:hypothetical protein
MVHDSLKIMDDRKTGYAFDQIMLDNIRFFNFLTFVELR